jgi:hypothetical protein
MKLDFGEVFTRTWKIGWNHKILWLWQMLPGVAVIFIFPSVFIFYPVFTRLIHDPELQIPIEPWMSISLNSMGTLFALSYVLMWIFAQIATICGAVEIEKGTAGISFRELSHKSQPHIWRILGLYFLFVLFLGLVELANFGFVALCRVFYKEVSAIPGFLFFLWVLPLSLALLVGIIIVELAQAAIVVNNMGVLAAVLHAWKIFKSNLLGLIILMVVLYFGVSIPLSLLLMPFLFLAFTSFWFLLRVSDPNVIFFTAFFVIIPLIVIFSTSLNGIFMTFFQTAWAVAYIRLDRNANAPIVLEEKPQEAEL